MFAHIATIDGPPAAGKTTMASLLAKKYGLTHLDSGAIFRTITLYCMENGVDLSNPQDVVKNIGCIHPHITGETVFLNGANVSTKIREPNVTNHVCMISHIPEIRKFVTDLQLSYAEAGGVVCDGRKVGTEVFPNAKVKFYLTADAHTRALRRYRQYLEKDSAVCFKDVYNDLIKREEHEVNNKILLVPQDPIIIDNSNMSIEETLQMMASYLK